MLINFYETLSFSFQQCRADVWIQNIFFCLFIIWWCFYHVISYCYLLMFLQFCLNVFVFRYMICYLGKYIICCATVIVQLFSIQLFILDRKFIPNNHLFTMSVESILAVSVKRCLTYVSRMCCLLAWK